MQSTRKIFKEIHFSKEILECFKIAKEIRETKGEFVAIHIRSGDAIFNIDYRNIFTSNGVFYKALASEIAIYMIKNELQKGAKVIVFGDDLAMFEVLKQNSKTLFNQSENLYTSHDFLEKLPKEFKDGVYRALFENYLMSLSKTLYYSKESGFSFLATMIGECRGVSLYEFYSKKEQYEILTDKSNKLEGIHPLQKAFSSFSAYRVAKDLNFKSKILQSYIKKAWQFDKENLLYAIMEFSYIVKRNKKKKLKSF